MKDASICKMATFKAKTQILIHILPELLLDLDGKFVFFTEYTFCFTMVSIIFTFIFTSYARNVIKYPNVTFPCTYTLYGMSANFLFFVWQRCCNWVKLSSISFYGLGWVLVTQLKKTWRARELRFKLSIVFIVIHVFYV